MGAEPRDEVGGKHVSTSSPASCRERSERLPPVGYGLSRIRKSLLTGTVSGARHALTRQTNQGPGKRRSIDERVRQGTMWGSINHGPERIARRERILTSSRRLAIVLFPSQRRRPLSPITDRHDALYSMTLRGPSVASSPHSLFSFFTCRRHHQPPVRQNVVAG